MSESNDQPRNPAAPNSWSIDDDEAQFLQAFVAANRVRTVLEFGPGKSTQALLAAQCQVWSLEHDPKWFEVLCEQLGAPRSPQAGPLNGPSGLQALLLYQVTPELQIPELNALRFDMAFIDGPPASFFKRFARINAIDFAAARTDVILLHDAYREMEQNSMAVMEERGWHWRVLPSRRGLAVGVRSGAAAIQWPQDRAAGV